MDIINQHFSDHYNVLLDEEFNGLRFVSIELRPKVTCKDGFEISIQASENHYCSPRKTFKPREGLVYDEVELGFPNMKDDLIAEYADDADYTKSVYPFVPVEIVLELIEKHGGMA